MEAVTHDESGVHDFPLEEADKYLAYPKFIVSPRQIFISHSYLVPRCDIKSITYCEALIAPRRYYVCRGSAKFPLCSCVHEFSEARSKICAGMRL